MKVLAAAVMDGVAVEVEATVGCEPSQIHSRSLLAERRFFLKRVNFF